jgi:diguanylate cyclase (GGDEF)-like protein/PAS domain S-box-containing protein
MAGAMEMSVDELEGASCYDLYPPEEAESFHRDDMRIVNGRKPVTDIIEPVTTPEGTLYFHTCKIPLMDAAGTVYGVLGIATDITKLKNAEEEKTMLNERLEFASSAGEIGVWDYDQHTGELVWNKTMFKLYGYEEDGTTPSYDVWSRALHPEDRESAEQFFSNALENNERFHTEFRIITPAGETRHIHASALPMMDEEGSLKGLVGINYEITRQKELEQNIRQLANTDPLTGVMNRRRFFELAEQEFERFKRYESPLSCLIIDADHFKSINDKLGHEAGDAVLKQLSKACESQLRINDIFCRFGGEEFVALLPETTLAQAEAVAEKLRKQVAELNPEINGRSLSISISLGIAEASAEDESISKMIERSDNALYRAKAKGRNRVERG